VLQGLGLLLSALMGLAVTMGLFAVGAVLVAVIGGILLLAGAGLALALKLGWRPALLRQAETLRRQAQSRTGHQPPLDGEYTVMGRAEREPRAPD
jgi:hypothetical protein